MLKYGNIFIRYNSSKWAQLLSKFQSKATMLELFSLLFENHSHMLWCLYLIFVIQILQCLTVQGGNPSGGDSSSLSRAMVKDRFKTFNTQFEELHQRQSQWTVPDSELRESLRLAVAEILLPAYRSFIKRFGYVFSYFRTFPLKKIHNFCISGINVDTHRVAGL